MIWTVEVALRPEWPDPVGHDALADLAAAGIAGITDIRTSRLYEIGGDLDRDQIERIAREILCDPVVERYRIWPSEAPPAAPQAPDCSTRRAAGCTTMEIRRKVGVMDPTEASARRAIADLGLAADSVATATRYVMTGGPAHDRIEAVARRVLANEIVDDVSIGSAHLPPIRREGQAASRPSECKPAASGKVEPRTCPILGKGKKELQAVSEKMSLSLSAVEMEAIERYFAKERREPTDVELQTIAQTWSEHCKHKTLMGPVEFDGRRFDDLLGETIKAATRTLDKDWCVSVFRDNAGVIEFDDRFDVCFKVETHNHPSAIEPYGGANTGLGGVIRDPLGTGLGAKPILSTDVFCFGPPDLPAGEVPAGVLHPRRIMKGVVRGVRDYGNRMGIPTVNGAVYFDERYICNPLVFCGNVGLIPKGMVEKGARCGDRIVVVGGRTGRDGIGGATFSSVTLKEESEKTSGGAVQIGNAITEKTVVDTILQARDEGLYRCITDCGAGGLSSAVGEMGEHTGAEVELDRVPLKYRGLSYTEIWISESQERMVIAVPPDKLERALKIFSAEDVEATDIGAFTSTGRLVLTYNGVKVLDLDMEFLHDGLPRIVHRAAWKKPPVARSPRPGRARGANLNETLRAILGSWNVCSKEWIIRQYDHEVQGGSILKPLVGAANDGPGDAAVWAPEPGSKRGLVIANGMNPRRGDLDPYAMAAGSIDEAVRNVVAVGGSLERCALLDNFCWGDANKPDRLGSLVLAALACRDVAIAYGTPFISGKDSLNNEFVAGAGSIAVPPSLLISAIAVIPDVTAAISMDAKRAGDAIYVVGRTKEEMGGSHLNLVEGFEGGTVPQVDCEGGLAVFNAMSRATAGRLVRSAHDCSEGGLAAALAEMAFAGGLGIEADLTEMPAQGVDQPEVALFSESNSRFVVEIEPDKIEAFESAMAGVPHRRVGVVTSAPRLAIAYKGSRVIDDDIAALKTAWQAPLAW